MMNLTRANYHSTDTNMVYMSHSQYSEFLQCEARAVARLRGECTEGPTEQQLAGSLLHAWNEGPEAYQEFAAKHTSELFNKKGELYAPFKQVQTMIDALRQDAFCMFVLQGEKEKILTAELFGVPWKIMIDVYNPEAGRIVEIKTTRSITEMVYSPEHGGRVSFVEAYHYPRQMAIYAEIERRATGRENWLEPIMVAVSKEDPPDKVILSFDDPARFEYELRQVELHLLRILAVKYGAEEPRRCGRCAYCRQTKKVDRIVHYTELEG